MTTLTTGSAHTFTTTPPECYQMRGFLVEDERGKPHSVARAIPEPMPKYQKKRTFVADQDVRAAH